MQYTYDGDRVGLEGAEHSDPGLPQSLQALQELLRLQELWRDVVEQHYLVQWANATALYAAQTRARHDDAALKLADTVSASFGVYPQQYEQMYTEKMLQRRQMIIAYILGAIKAIPPAPGAGFGFGPFAASKAATTAAPVKRGRIQANRGVDVLHLPTFVSSSSTSTSSSAGSTPRKKMRRDRKPVKPPPGFLRTEDVLIGSRAHLLNVDDEGEDEAPEQPTRTFSTCSPRRSKSKGGTSGRKSPPTSVSSPVGKAVLTRQRTKAEKEEKEERKKKKKKKKGHTSEDKAPPDTPATSRQSSISPNVFADSVSIEGDKDEDFDSLGPVGALPELQLPLELEDTSNIPDMSGRGSPLTRRLIGDGGPGTLATKQPASGPAKRTETPIPFMSGHTGAVIDGNGANTPSFVGLPGIGVSPPSARLQRQVLGGAAAA